MRLIASVMCVVLLCGCSLVSDFLYAGHEESQPEEFVSKVYIKNDFDLSASTYFRDQMDESGQKAYDEISEAVRELKNSVDVPELSQEDAKAVMQNFKRDNPGVFWLPQSYETILVNGKVTRFNIEYKKPNGRGEYTVQEIERLLEKINQKAEDYLSGIDISSSSDYETALYIHDKLADHIEYKETARSYSVLGALLDGEAVCEGYSKAFMLLCGLAGIDCVTASGDALTDGEYVAHMWNKAKLGGIWCNIDLTFDDPSGSDAALHTYFGLTDSEIKKDRTFAADSYKLPVCKDESVNYFAQQGRYYEAFDDSLLAQAISDVYLSGASTLEFKLAGEIYDEAYEKLFGEEYIYHILLKSKSGFNKTHLEYSDKNPFNTVRIKFFRYT